MHLRFKPNEVGGDHKLHGCLYHLNVLYWPFQRLKCCSTTSSSLRCVPPFAKWESCRHPDARGYMMLEVLRSSESELTSPQQIKSYRQYGSKVICTMNLWGLTELAASHHPADMCGEIFSCKAEANTKKYSRTNACVAQERSSSLQMLFCKLLAKITTWNLLYTFHLLNFNNKNQCSVC